jgi:protein SCO1/2
MFYASCPMACPMLIEDVRALERQVPDDARDDLRVLLVSLDPARDTPEALADVVRRHAIDGSRWTLARPAPDDVRLVAAVLGIAYRDDGAGGMNHSSILTLLDRDGRPVVRLEGLQRDPAPILEALRSTGIRM